MAQQYSIDNLMRIGEQCSLHLPPTSAVQAMFLYELQRGAEHESLFHAHTFRIARAEDAAASVSVRLQQLEERMQKPERQELSHDVKMLLANSNMRMQQQQTSLHSCVMSMETLQKRLDGLEAQFARLEDSQNAVTTEKKVNGKSAKHVMFADDIANIYKKLSNLGQIDDTTIVNATMELQTELEVLPITAQIAAVMISTRREVAAAQSDMANIITALQSELANLTTIADRVSKLEDLVRALTKQKTPQVSPLPSPVAVQNLDVTTQDGRGVELRVPKGASLITVSTMKKENIPPHRRNRNPTPAAAEAAAPPPEAAAPPPEVAASPLDAVPEENKKEKCAVRVGVSALPTVGTPTHPMTWLKTGSESESSESEVGAAASPPEAAVEPPQAEETAAEPTPKPATEPEQTELTPPEAVEEPESPALTPAPVASTSKQAATQSAAPPKPATPSLPKTWANLMAAAARTAVPSTPKPTAAPPPEVAVSGASSPPPPAASETAAPLTEAAAPPPPVLTIRNLNAASQPFIPSRVAAKPPKGKGLNDSIHAVGY